MKKRFTLITAAVMLLTMMASTGTVWGQSDKSEDYTGNVTLSTTGGTSATAVKVKISNTDYDGIKAGTGSKKGAVKVSVPAGTKYLHLHLAAWNGETVTLDVKQGSTDVTSIALTANTGISGGGNTYTWGTTGTNSTPNSSNHYKVITFASPLESAADYTFTASSSATGNRFVIWGVTAEKTHTITYSASNGSISGVLYNTSTVVASGDPIVEGGKVTLTATPTEGYSFSGWSVSGTGSTLSSTSTNPTTFTMGTANATVTATFEVASVCATPTFTVAEGTYNAAQSVELNCLTDGATIYYTTDGSNPTTSSSVYSSAINVNVSKTIKAFAVKAGLENSSIASATYTLKCATPTITVPEGAFLDTKTVTMESASAGVSIYYTTNGSTPTSSSTAYDPSNKPTISVTTTFKAIAIKDGWTDSDIATETFTKITPSTVDAALTAIAALDDNGTIANQYVAGKISQIDEYFSSYHSITYWISDDGTTTSQLEVYSGKGLNGANFSAVTDLTVGDDVVVLGTLKKYVSGTTTTPEFTANSQIISITPKVKTPTFSPAAGAVAEGTNVTISTTTEGATIYYTTDGSTPTTSSSVYSAPITVSVAMTIKALAVKDGYLDSSVAEAAYTIAEPCATPTFSEAAGEVDPGTTVTISTGTGGATIYYTTDGTDPTTSSSVYSSAITINTAMTLKAIAAKDGMANSEVASASYTIKDYATLPFVWTGGNTTSGGGKDDLTAMTGVTASGLGSDYAQSNAPYRIKFDNKDDYIRIKLDGQPARITIAVKMLGGGTTSKIKVQESATGESFTDIEELTIAGASNAVLNFDIANTFSATTRYVKIIKSVHGSNVGVGPIVIYKTTEIAPNPTWTPSDFTPVANNVYVISGGNTLTLNGDFSSIFNDPKILVIEDGGQLIHSNNVNATMKRTANGYGGSKGGSGWYTIASPVDGASLALVTSGSGNHDLYRYDETNMKWLNAKNPENISLFSNLSRGIGYLYANEETQTLNISGEMIGTGTTVTIPLTYTCANETYKGINLVGNPFTCNVSDNVTVGGTDLTSYYYVSNGSELASVLLSERPIQPCEGFLVKATAASQDLVFNPTSKGETDYKPAYIRIEAGNDAFMDRAYVLVGNSNTLPKVTINEQVAHVSVYYNQADYAVASVAKAKEEIPVNFKAAYDGNYSISVSTVGLDLNYLHLIDKLTGNDIDLLATPEYTFSAKRGDGENRFRLVFEANGNALVTSNEPFAYFNGSEWVIENDGNATLQVIDVMGRMLRSENVSGNATTSLPNLSAGVYVLRLVNSESIRTQKVVIE